MSKPVMSSPEEPMPIARGSDLHRVSTYDEIMSVTEAARSLLGRLGIGLHRDSALSMLFREAQAATEAFNKGLPSQNSAREVLRIAQANRVASAIVAVGEDPGAREGLRRMTSGEMNLSERATSHGKRRGGSPKAESTVARLGGRAIVVPCSMTTESLGTTA